MKIALWRYGMSLQTGAQSTVGGGLLATGAIRALVQAGHEVSVVGPVAKGADLAALGVRHRPSLIMHGYDAVVMLTGPYNPLYGDAAFDTYRRLAAFEGVVAYLQWDVALPFHFGAAVNPKAAARMGVVHADVTRNKRWFVLAQKNPHLRIGGGKSVGYADAPFEHVHCLFELIQLQQAKLSPAAKPISALGYFGSDRPGRMAEIERWFANVHSPNVHLYGRWSVKSLRRVDEAQGMRMSLEYRGMVPEETVTTRLNAYASTMYLADPEYVKTDFIAQRFFENVTAGVPVLYSDKLQPSVRAVIPNEWICSSAVELNDRFIHISKMSHKQRNAYVHDHAASVHRLAAHREDTITRALQQVLGTN